MTNDWHALHTVRHRWMKAYYQGDVDYLDRVQMPSFFAKSGRRFTTKAQQLEAIAAGMNRGLERVEIEDVVDELDHGSDWLTVKGVSVVTLDGALLGRYRYFELWILFAGEWNVSSLCYDEI